MELFEAGVGKNGLETPWGYVVQTKDGFYTIRNPAIDECYHCFQGALFEARFLYLENSGIRTRFEERAIPHSSINLLDVGLGLGYNAVSTAEAWLGSPSPSDLCVTSLEIEASLVDAFTTGQAPWQSNWNNDFRMLATALKKESNGNFRGRLSHPNGQAAFSWLVIVGDALSAELPGPSDGYHFVWQDPFSPGKGPDLWSRDWFARVGKVAAPQCRLMTFSVARTVKDNLTGAGWSWRKIKGPKPGKRHWIEATWPGVAYRY